MKKSFLTEQIILQILKMTGLAPVTERTERQKCNLLINSV